MVCVCVICFVCGVLCFICVVTFFCCWSIWACVPARASLVLLSFYVVNSLHCRGLVWCLLMLFVLSVGLRAFDLLMLLLSFVTSVFERVCPRDLVWFFFRFIWVETVVCALRLSERIRAPPRCVDWRRWCSRCVNWLVLCGRADLACGPLC